MARFGSDIRVDKKGAIDLVTEVDVEVERMFRALIAERFPDHDVLAEEMGQTRDRRAHRWVFDPLDGTTNYAHGMPIFCSTLALEIDGEPTVGAVFDPNRRELFTAERGVGAWLNGEPLHVSTSATLNDSVLVTGFPTTSATAWTTSSSCSPASCARRAPCAGSDRPRSTCAGSRRAAWTGSGSRACRRGTRWRARSWSRKRAAA